MRIIAGKARGTILKTPDGLNTRPTTDRIKETLFNMIQPYLADCVFLDLFSGSGGIGLEAVSRGAKRAYLVEQDKAALRCISDNVNKCHMNDSVTIVAKDVLFSLEHVINEKCDVIFMDPPYNQGFEKKVLEIIKDSSIIDDDTLIIIEASLETDFSYLDELGFKIYKTKLYKTNQHVMVKGR